MLLFRVGNEPWAIAVSQVQAVVPLVTLQKLPYGLFNQPKSSQLECNQTKPSQPNSIELMTYRGQNVPVIDVSALMSNRPSPQTLNTRIAIVEATAPTDKAHRQPANLSVGLILEQVSETAALEPVVNIPTASPYVQANWQMASNNQVIRQLAIDPIVAQVHQKPLESRFAPSFNGTSKPSLDATATTNGFSKTGV